MSAVEAETRFWQGSPNSPHSSSLSACLGKSPRTSHFRSHDAAMSWPVVERVMFVLMQATRSGCKSSVRHSTAIAYLGEISCGNLHSGFHLVLLGAYAPWRYVSSRLQMVLTEKREVALRLSGENAEENRRGVRLCNSCGITPGQPICM